MQRAAMLASPRANATVLAADSPPPAIKKHSDESGTGDAWQAGHDAVIGCWCAVRVTLCVSGIVRAVHQSSSKLGDTPLARLDLFESLHSRRFGCRASTTNSTTKSRSTSLYNAGASSRGGCRALQLYSALHLYSSTALYTLHPLHPPSAAMSQTRRTVVAGEYHQPSVRVVISCWLIKISLSPTITLVGIVPHLHPSRDFFFSFP